MHDSNVHQRFIELRSQGQSFARVAQELNVSKPTLIQWSRKFRFEIQNLRAIRLEHLRETLIGGFEQQAQRLGAQLRAVQQELSKRDLCELSTARLYSLADSLRRQINCQIGTMLFTTPIKDIPNDEYHEQVQDWKP